MDVSASGVNLIAEFEGVRLEPYRDAVGVWTIGYGHTGPGTETMRLKDIAEAKALLHKDLRTYVRVVNAYVKVPLSQGQFDALVSLVYNIGGTAFYRSTLLARLNGGHYARAANHFRDWRYAGGKSILLARRMKERAVFLAGSNRGTKIVARTGVL